MAYRILLRRDSSENWSTSNTVLMAGEPGYVTDTGELKIGKRNFRGWKLNGHGKTDFTKAIRESVDDFFYKGSLIVGYNVAGGNPVEALTNFSDSV